MVINDSLSIADVAKKIKIGYPAAYKIIRVYKSTGETEKSKQGGGVKKILSGQVLKNMEEIIEKKPDETDAAVGEVFATLSVVVSAMYTFSTGMPNA